MSQRRFVLRDLPLAARVTLAVFLVAVALGYAAALVQLHLQHAGPGRVIPSTADAVRLFHGSPGNAKSHLQRLVEADESLPFNGTGSMAAAFTRRSDGWTRAIRDRVRESNVAEPAAEAALRAERDGERQVLLAWLAAPARDPFDADRFPLPPGWGDRPLTAAYRDGDTAKVKSLFADRCVRCHAADGDDAEASAFPLETFEQVLKYARPDSGGGRMSLDKLAQTTHAHLLSFAMLFMLTGVLFALTRYPAWMRLSLAPLVLVAQVLDIACWWLARIDGQTGEWFAMAIPFTGSVVGVGLALQIVLTLFHLFGALGRLVLALMMIVAAFGAYMAKERVVDPFLGARAEPVNKN